MAENHDFKKLDVERAKFAVSIQEARDSVSQWMSPDFQDDDDPDESPVKTSSSSTAGLGAVVEKPEPTQNNTALGKLQRTYAKNAKNNEKAAPNSKSTGKSAANASTKSASPDAHSDSDSDSDAISRTSVKTKRRGTVSAIDAYKQRKKKKR